MVILVYCAVSSIPEPLIAEIREAQVYMKSKKQVVSEFRRTEIIDAARSVFARRGFSLGIMDEIAKEAGIAKGTIYLYFRSKTNIYKAVLHHDMQALNKNTLQQIDAAQNLKDKIRAFALARLQNAEDKRDFFLIMDSEHGSLSLTRRQYRDWLSEPVLRLASAIEEAASHGVIRPVPAEKTAWIVADMTRGAIQRRLLGQSNLPPQEEAEFLLNFIWTSLAPGADPLQSQSLASAPASLAQA
jgi:AcrR family transcriptional regulator